MLDALSTSSNREDIVPKPQILKDLLAALEPRCMATGFSDLVLTWDSRIHNQTALFELMDGQPSAGPFPSPEGLGKLIAAFRSGM
ncbi:uncharacterized protein N7483_010130 [Penicillium malachiteum]|uniref:uncharacterized protein n=1 Tax=Penicillium malachiteum TaxID=1324776 RepID=UPI0025482B8A|nr:uncharacterized protein N7483_010130 [Penicillium malachiteum]KAJ5712949.1 hypothetical protein N7483_010130 [Penicillium malachiteum]